MVNNSTDINKKNNHLSHQSTEHKETMTYDIGNPGPGLGQPQKCDRV
jgi:hypothetical protein